MKNFYISFIGQLILTAGCMLILHSCAEKPQPITDPAARVGNRWLSKAEVRRNIPAGVSGQDSIKAANAIIKNWVENEATMIVAERNIPDTEEIDKLVENYRRELLMWEYRRRKIEENVIEPMMTEQQLDEYISKHAGAYILDHPIIKGIYIKISDNAHELNDVRQLYTSDKADDIDKLDKLIESAVSYEYFRDTWRNWHHIADRIPYDGFDSNPEEYPMVKKNLDHRFDGYVYLLHITDVISPGKPMPASYAKPFVIESIRREKALDFDKTIRQLLTSEALADGTAQIF